MFITAKDKQLESSSTGTCSSCRERGGSRGWSWSDVHHLSLSENNTCDRTLTYYSKGQEMPKPYLWTPRRGGPEVRKEVFSLCVLSHLLNFEECLHMFYLRERNKASKYLVHGSPRVPCGLPTVFWVFY